MRNRLNLKKGQAGLILIFVTIVLALAAIIIPSVLTLTNASHRSAQINKEKTQQFYAADTGVEDALHKMGNGTFTTGNYIITGGVNGYDVAVSIEAIDEQGIYRITSTATDPISGINTEVVTDVPICTLTININQPGWGNTTPTAGIIHTYPGGLIVDLVATPAACHDFGNWTGDVGTIDNAAAAATSITMNGNYTITANFEWQRLLTVSCTIGGRVSVTAPSEQKDVYPGPPQTFGCCNGFPVPLTATPDPGYDFIDWTGAVGTMGDPSAASTYITMNGDYEIWADFVEVPQYTLTVSHNGNGTVISPGEDTFTYPENQVVTLEAVADPGSGFVNWTGSTTTIGNVTGASTTITMNGNYVIWANFSTRSLNVSHSTGGHVTQPGEGTFYYGPGTVVSLVATPDSGYTFINWTGDTGTIENADAAGTTITMNGDYSIVANFAPSVFCYDCWHYAIATLGGEGQDPFQNSGVVNGDIYVSASAGLQNSFVLNGKFYIDGDLTLQNSININDDVYVQGNLLGSNSQRIYGNAYATGDITLQNSAAITKSAYSQGSISLKTSSQIQGDAHYQDSISMSGGSSVLGDLYHETVTMPPFPEFHKPTDPETTAKALEYKNAALAGGTYTGSMTINSNTSLGPKYITGNLNINNNKVLTLTGTIYVEGTITLQNNSRIIMGAGGPYAIVTSGNIVMNNNITVDTTDAIPMIMSVNGDITSTGSANIKGIIYAPNGTVTLANSVVVYGSVVGQVVNTTNSTVITHAPELDDSDGLPPCGCDS